MSYRIDEIEGIGSVYADKLAAVGIRNTGELLKQCASRKGRKAVAGNSDLTEKQLLKWANMADLMRITGIGSEYSELLEAAGVDTVKELRVRNAENLTRRMKEVNADKKLTRRTPSLSAVESWIEQADKLPPMITH